MKHINSRGWISSSVRCFSVVRLGRLDIWVRRAQPCVEPESLIENCIFSDVTFSLNKTLENTTHFLIFSLMKTLYDHRFIQ